MKAFVCIMALFIAIPAFSQEFTKKEIKKHCNGFAKAVTDGDMELCLLYFDKEYLEVQHNDFLQGNTEQFLEEFLAGYDMKAPEGEQIIVPVFSEINSCKLIKLKATSSDSYMVIFEIKLVNGITYLIETQVVKSPSGIGLVGAMG